MCRCRAISITSKIQGPDEALDNPKTLLQAISKKPFGPKFLLEVKFKSTWVCLRFKFHLRRDLEPKGFFEMACRQELQLNVSSINYANAILDFRGSVDDPYWVNLGLFGVPDES
jgi:hypothetical protein